MNRQRVVVLPNTVVRGEELDSAEFHDPEGFRRCATQWGGPDGVLILRNVTLETQGETEQVDFLLVRRSEVLAVGMGPLSLEGMIARKPGQVVG